MKKFSALLLFLLISAGANADLHAATAAETAKPAAEAEARPVVAGYAEATRPDPGSSLWLPQCVHSGAIPAAAPSAASTREVIARELSAWKGVPVKTAVDAKALRSRATKAAKPQALCVAKPSAKNDERMADSYLINFTPEEITVTGASETATLYGVYHLIRLRQSGRVPASGEIYETPAFALRMLNHWGNLDGSVERGYAGHSIWQWDSLPAILSPRYEEYARANASIGINGTVLNNVNANPQILTPEYLEKVKVLASIFRPYGLKVYLSVNFASPKVLGGLPTADPLDKQVIRWWKEKADEIYKEIPDFGGVLVKANSEGQAGPCDYGRTHAEGANMLAKAFAPHGGKVIWRAFVYNPTEEDRAKQAYSEFKPLDGDFLPNVILQVKNGPIDFQPREPFSPLFGAMKKTPGMVEFQITQEYLGHANHLAYLAPMWKEFFDEVPAGSVGGVAGVANIGDDTNWTGHDFAQSNWYAFGRLAWNPDLSAGEIADEWIAGTFSTDEKASSAIAGMMMRSREAVVDYMMPLGLHHIFAVEHHYGPQPWFTKEGFRPDWTPPYYHKADADGIGFNRTATGSDALSQYPADFAAKLADPATCPAKYILWFHHLPWDYIMGSGRTLWEEMGARYQHGVDETRDFMRIWAEVSPQIDATRRDRVADKLRMQSRDAMWWRDACLGYFGEISGLPLPDFVEPPLRNMNEIKAFEIPLGICGNASSGFY